MEKREGTSRLRILRHYYFIIIYLGMAALQELAGPAKNLKPVLVKCLQFQIQAQLQRELIGCDRLVRQGRVSFYIWKRKI